MYSRQNRNGQGDISVELPRDYSGNAFPPFRRQADTLLRNTGVPAVHEAKPAACGACKAEGEPPECERESPAPPPCPTEAPPKGLSGLKGLLGGDIGLEELLLLGVIFLIFSDSDLRDNELLICLLLILFI